MDGTLTMIKTEKRLKYKCGNCPHISIFIKEDLKKFFEKNYIIINCKECGESITVLKTDVFKKEKAE